MADFDPSPFKGYESRTEGSTGEDILLTPVGRPPREPERE